MTISDSVADTGSGGGGRKLISFLGREFREMLPPTLFFFVGFNLVLFTKRLILEDYLIQYAGFLIATMSALVVGKSVLVANAMPFLRRFDNAPLVYPVLFKTFVYTLFVFVARLIEALVHYLVQGGLSWVAVGSSSMSSATSPGRILQPCSCGSSCCS